MVARAGEAPARSQQKMQRQAEGERERASGSDRHARGAL